MAGFEITGHVDGVRGGLAGDGSGDEIGELSLVERDTLSFGDTTNNELGCLGDDTNRVDVRGTRGLHTDERKDERKEQRNNANTCIEMELEVTDDKSSDSGNSQTDNPCPERDLFVLGRGVLEHLVSFRLGLGEFDAILAGLALAQLVARVRVSALHRPPEDRCRVCNLSERVAHHQEDTGPEQPVTRRGAVDVVLGAHAGIADPPGDVFRLGRTESLALLDEDRANDTPRENRAEHERPGRVETRKHAGAKEGGSELNEPAPGLGVDNALPSPGVEPPEDVPVPEDTGSIAGDGLEDEGAAERGS